MAVRVPTLRARALIVAGRRIVVSSERRRGRQHLTLPGGRVRFGESMTEALVREIGEETGLRVEVGALVYVAEVIRPHRWHDLNLIYVAEPIGAGDLDGLDAIDVDRDQVASVMPPILDRVRDDLGAGWPPTARYLGNVYQGDTSRA